MRRKTQDLLLASDNSDKSLKRWSRHSCLLIDIKPKSQNPVTGHATSRRRLPHSKRDGAIYWINLNSRVSPRRSGSRNSITTWYAAKDSIGASSARSRKTQQRPDCATTRRGDRPVAPTLYKRRKPFFCLHSERPAMRTADRNVCPTFTRASSTARHATVRGWS